MLSRYLPKTFQFSLTATLISITLCLVMIRASTWQWSRYLEKVALVQTYAENSGATALPLPPGDDFSAVIHRKVHLKGEFDFAHELIVTNRMDRTGPGHLLFAPFRLADGANDSRSVMVSRGFIPFPDREAASWTKYDEPGPTEFNAVVQRSVPATSYGPQNPDVSLTGPFAQLWYFEEIEKMSKQLPYPIVQLFYLQQLGGPSHGMYPAESISIEVPPTTHFGYTIEWAMLSVFSLIAGFFYQVYPWGRKLGIDLATAPERKLDKSIPPSMDTSVTRNGQPPVN